MWRFFKITTFIAFVCAQTDYVPPNFDVVTEEMLNGFGATDRCGDGEQQGKNICVPYHRCDPETNTTIPENTDPPPEEDTDYSLLIDIRLGVTNPCPETLQVCCKISEGEISPSPRPTAPTPSSEKPIDGDVSTQTPLPGGNFCGKRNINGIGFKITGNSHKEAEYGEFPWMVAILKSNYDPSIDPSLAICGGSLIAPRVVLTGAHCVLNFTASDVRVRAGEWDTQTNNEKYPYQERDVAQIILHENFKDGRLYNDVALLVLERPFSKARHIGTICLPEENEVIVSKECYATGWGKNLFGKQGEYQVILKKIDLPIVPKKQCEAALKKTRLGPYFKLHESFTCAGGVEGKDTCTGDGGSPLVCRDSNNPSRYVQAGIVAWGIGCGTATPGVYADVAKFRNWVDEKMQRLNLSTKPYTI